jgi:hypothetical protein
MRIRAVSRGEFRSTRPNALQAAAHHRPGNPESSTQLYRCVVERSSRFERVEFRATLKSIKLH